MRLSASAIALVVGLLLNPLAQAGQVPLRLVSVGGALSEWVVALGAESKLVGVDTTSQHPESLKALPSIGYQRQLSAEGILSLSPQILVGTEEMGPPPVLAQLRGAGVRVELFSAEPDLLALQANLKRLGNLLGSEAKATLLFADFQQQLDRQKSWVAKAQTAVSAPGVLLLLGHSGGKLLIAGKHTAADWILQHAGGNNLATHTGYKPFSVESLAGLSPDVLVFADRALTGEEAQAALFKENPILRSTPAAMHGRVIELDPTLLVGGLGPRLPHSLMLLSAGFYPAQAEPAP
ncbi:ABC transporter substrate-binding protein [Pseudomonas sp. ICBG1301]|uniref:heme/hemin ABC transporter substrate-binding protein n=1 Tax=Pseudomonas sp. ICBG1301 TaxID=2795987 RepID=UPI0019635CF4|nr:ABC transporter substrate-binding protein [Pseudomonas sp. ICBG1301]MBM9488112.1 ABC transporter substrate-binding protein [Pseudomonas sp. ICBG1301]